MARVIPRSFWLLLNLQCLIWCPGILEMFLFYCRCFLPCVNELSSFQAPVHVLHTVRYCWWTANPSVTVCANSYSHGLGEATGHSHPAGFALRCRWHWGPNNCLKTHLGYYTWQRENSLDHVGSKEGGMWEQGWNMVIGLCVWQITVAVPWINQGPQIESWGSLVSVTASTCASITSTKGV